MTRKRTITAAARTEAEVGTPIQTVPMANEVVDLVATGSLVTTVPTLMEERAKKAVARKAQAPKVEAVAEEGNWSSGEYILIHVTCQ